MRSRAAVPVIERGEDRTRVVRRCRCKFSRWRENRIFVGDANPFLQQRPYPMKFLLLSLLSSLVVLSACSKQSPPAQKAGTAIDTNDVYSLEVRKDRKEKDLYFLTGENTPLLATDKEEFQGLNYYPPSKEFAFMTALKRFPAPEPTVIATSKNKPRNMLCIGTLPFRYQGKDYALRVYMPTDTTEEHYWFIPFTDATTGTETYGAGRFIDIEHPTTDSTFLDFNYAYNPYCAYNERYDCPIPPRENALPFAIRAGEKKYRAGH
jgi:uncharacterized protein